jgi:histidinol-phosphatase (PHP family)
MLLTNYHTHTKFCDGKEFPVSYAEEAIRQNIKVLGFSAHAPVPFPCNWPMPVEKYKEYSEIILSLKNQYNGKLEILHGLEIDYIPDLWPQMHKILNPQQLDYFIGSIHFIDYFPDGTRWSIDGSNEEFRKGWEEIFHRDSSRLVKKYFEYTRRMIKEMKPPIIGHLDKIKMQYSKDCFIPETDPVYREELMQTLEEVSASNCVVELNTRGAYRRNEKEFYPSSWVLKEMAKMKIPVMINSDAHHPQELMLLFDVATECLQTAGYKNIKYFSKGIWLETEL